MRAFPRVGDRFGRYAIDAQVGQGGMGVVFLATDTELDRQVALKVVSAALGGSTDILARFAREASLLARLNSPHVIAIFDHGEQDGCPYIATQYVAGGDLGSLLAARGPMPPALALRVVAQVADALSDAHRAGVVHRDVKPTNVLLRDADTLDLHAYLCDFGIARGHADGLTAPGSVSGTWSYLAPEVGAGAVGTEAADLYAAGCLLWAALTGRAPYGGTDVEVAIAHQRAPVPQLAGDDALTRHLNAILSNTLAKDPRSRYADAEALRADLLAAAVLPATGAPLVPARQSGSDLRARTGASSPAPGGTQGPARGRRTALLAAGAALALVAVTGGVAALVLRDDDPGAGSGTTGGETTGETTGTATEAAAPQGAVTGDLDGDGLGDFAMATREGPQEGESGEDYLVVATWSSDGTALVAGEDQRTDAAGLAGMDLRLGDLDGDGVGEQVLVGTTDAAEREVVVRATLSGGGELDARLPRPATPGGELVTVMVGDVDGDGLDDLALLTWGDEGEGMGLSTARNEGGGFAAAVPALRLTPDYTDAVVEVGDVDGDDLLDVVVVEDTGGFERYFRNQVQVHRGAGDGRFATTPLVRDLESGIGTEVLLGDLDADGDDEVVTVGLKGDLTQVIGLDVTDEVSTPRPYGLVPQVDEGFFYTHLAVSDVDGDGRDDVVALAPAVEPEDPTNRLTVLLADGDRFLPATDWGTWRADLQDAAWTALGESFP